MPADLIALDKLRKMLPATAVSLTDAQLTEFRGQLYQLATVILDANEEFSGRNDLVDALLADCARMPKFFADEIDDTEELV